MVNDDERVVDQGCERRLFSDASVNHQRAERVDNRQGKLRNTVIGNPRKRQKSVVQAAQRELTKGDKNDDALAGYFSKIREVCNVLNLEGRVNDVARDLIFRYEKVRDPHRRSLPVLESTLAVIHLACTQMCLGRTMGDLLCDLQLAEVEVPDDRDVWEVRKKFVQALPGIDAQARAEDVIYSLCTTLNASRAVRQVAARIEHNMHALVEGKTVSTIAAGVILIAAQALEDFSVTRDDVAGVAGVSTTTLASFCKIGQRHWANVVPPPAELAKIKGC